MKKHVSIFLVACLMLMYCFVGGAFASEIPAMEGSGTGGDAFKIVDGRQFSLIANNLTATYQVMNEITLPEDYVPIKNFNGKLFSEGSCGIINVKIIRPDEDEVGLFSTTLACTISNIIIAGEVSGKNHVGGLIGRANGKINISNCSNQAKILGNSNTAIGSQPGVGGLIGLVFHPGGYQSTISGCSNTGYVENFLGQCVGGIVGYLHAGLATISKSYNIGEVYGNTWIGGIAGALNTGTITESWNKGLIRASSTAAAGICGYNNAGKISKSYNSGTVNSSANAAGIAAGLATATAKIESCYNTGDIYAAGVGYAAGICANIMAATTNIMIERCYNVGEVKSNTAGYNGGIYSSYLGSGMTIEKLNAVIIKNLYLSSDSSHDDLLTGTTPLNLGNLKLGTDSLNEGLTTAVYQAPGNSIYPFPEIIGNLNVNPFAMYEINATAGTGGHIAPAGIFYVKGGKKIKFTIAADPGYMVEEITYGVSPISILNHTEGGIYETPEITENKEISVAFIDFVFPTVLPEDTLTVKRSYVPENYAEPQIIGEVEINTPYGISFARVNTYSGYTLLEYGVLFSKTNSNLNMESYDHKAVGTLKNSYGQFGILFYGSGINTQTDYYTRSYAKYQKEGEEPVVILGAPSGFKTN